MGYRGCSRDQYEADRQAENGSPEWTIEGKKEPWRMGTELPKLVPENNIKQRTMDLQPTPAIVNEA